MIAPFDRAHMSSYYPSVVTMLISCTTSEIGLQRDVCRKSPILTYYTSIWRPVGVTPLEFRQDV